MNLYYINFGALEELQSNIDKSKEGFELSRYVNQRQEMQVTSDGVAIIDMMGVLMDSPAPIMEELGNTAYQTIEREIKEALEQGAKSILFRVKSPGGSVTGGEELATIISNLEIPTIAHGTGVMCSASYKLSSSCDIVSATPSCNCGNIGSILPYSDASKFYENIGIEHKAFTNKQATLKSTFHTAKLTEEQAQFLQTSIDEAGERFISHVQKHRPDIKEEAFKAGWYCGDKALEIGLVDGIGTFEEAYETAIALQHQLETL